MTVSLNKQQWKAGLGIVDRFIVTRIGTRSIFGSDNKEMRFTQPGLNKLQPNVGDIFFLFQGGLVGVASTEFLTDTANLNDNARFCNGILDARRRSIRSVYYVRAVFEQDKYFWIAAFSYATLSGLRA